MIFSSKKIIAIVAFVVFCGHVVAQTEGIQLYPNPQFIEQIGKRFIAQHSYHIIGIQDVDAIEVLNEIIKIDSLKTSLPFVITLADKNEKRVQRSGAYQLTIAPEKINLMAFDARSIFYAVQTLRQLARINSNGEVTLPVVKITDYPDVASRGIVEGFYGEPWSHPDRLEQLKFYGKLKLNTYIYGPKDDPYHSSPHWRKPYPEQESKQLRELVAEAKKNKVDFVWAIHPGKDINWNKEDSNAIIDKFEKMYDLGVRSFAVFFDDISGAGTDAHKQAGLLNYIHHHFIKPKKDITPLIMCPTEYNRSWANKKEGTYLDILGEQLDKNIHVMWTGNRVVDDITKEGLQWVNNRIKRPAFVWWNFPVSDYVRDHLLMGPAYGLDKDAAVDMGGFVSNPMDKAEASKPAIFSVALYSWNMKGYDPQGAWQAALQYIMPEASAALQLFAVHNSDPGPNGHRYRRKESEHIKGAVDTFLKTYKDKRFLKHFAAQIENEFERMVPVGEEIKTNSKNRRLVEQVSPWLTQFEVLSKAGVHTMQMAHNWHVQNYANAWDNYLQISGYLDSMDAVDKAWNKNPYQPGIKTGSLVLTPFVKEIYQYTGNMFAMLSQVKDAEGIQATPANTIFTNVPRLQHQPLRINNSQVAIAPVLETVTLSPGGYVGIQFNSKLKVTSVHFNLESGNPLDWGRFETSMGDNNWQPLATEEKKGKGVIKNIKDGMRFLRFRNISDKAQAIYLKEFLLEVVPTSGIDGSVFAIDRSLSTWQSFTQSIPATVILPKGFTNRNLTLLLSNNGANYTISALNKRGKKSIIHTGSQAFVEIDLSKIKNAEKLHFTTESDNPVLIYEIVNHTDK